MRPSVTNRGELRNACVAVVEPTDSRKRNNSTALDRFDLATMRRTLIEGLVNAVVVIDSAA